MSVEQFYNLQYLPTYIQGTYVPWGQKNKMVNLHTTTTKVKNRPHHKTITYPHAPPAPPQPHAEFLCGGEGIIQPPHPTLTGLEVEAVKYSINTYVQYLNYTLSVIAEMPNYELTGNHTLSLPPLYL